MIAVTFDYGQTIAELDTEYLSRRALEWGARVDRARLDAASPTAWRAYDESKRRGDSGYGAWGTFMKTLVSVAGVVSITDPAEDVTARLVEYLWSEQPRRNLWRRPIAGMEELLADLVAKGVPLGIVSNSEGRLKELLEEMGLARFFRVVADSGVLGFEKPDRRIFDHAARGLGTRPEELVHVGDAWVADVEGALGVGARAIWVSTEPRSDLPSGVAAAGTADDIRSALRTFGVPA
jgi:HAD superfamily hydrolase (TIGR01509 family)